MMTDNEETPRVWDEASEAAASRREDVPRVWVGCLGCYGNGGLVGDWFVAVDCPTGEEDWRMRVGVTSYTHRDEAHEELWVFDYENFHGALKGECSPAEAQRIATALAAVASEGYPIAAFAPWLEMNGYQCSAGVLSDYLPEFSDAYCGEYESGADYAQDVARDSFEVAEPMGRNGGNLSSYLDRWPFTCIDWYRAWHELQCDGYWTHPTGTGSVYVFRSP